MVVDDIDVVKTGTKRKADQDIEEIKAKRTKTSSEENDDIVVLWLEQLWISELEFCNIHTHWT